MEKHIYGRTLKTHQRAILDLHAISSRTLPQEHMEISRSNERQTGLEPVAIFRLPNPNRAKFVQSMSE